MPTANIFAFAVNGQRTAFAYIVDKQRYQLFGELIRTVVVRAVGNHRGHTVCVVESTHKVVAAGLGCRVGRMWLILSVFCEELVTVGRIAFGFGKLKSTVNLVGGDMVETFAVPIAVPHHFGSLQKAQRTHHIGLCEGKGVFNAAVHVTLGGKVYHAVYLMFTENLEHTLVVADVGFYKNIVGFVLYIFQVSQIAGVGQFVKINYLVIRIFINKKTNHVRANESGAACYQNILHLLDFKILIHSFRESFQ